MENTQQTQPATQQVLDPRRIGRDNSGLDEEDVADILCILTPGSTTAYNIVSRTAKHQPEHVLMNPYDSFDHATNIEEQETIIVNRPHVGSSHTYAGADLALRMSSRLIDPGLGFVFGRNWKTSDIVFSQDSGKRTSNQHFRIFLNSDAVLMIEDMSTNGLAVDNLYLRCRDPKAPKTCMLEPNSIICIANNVDAELIKFSVRVPSRASHLSRYEENVRNFLTRCAPDGEKLKTTLERLGTRRLGGTTMHWDGGARYNIIGQIGKGAFATVYQLATKMEGKVLAAKELEKRRFMKNGQLDKKIDNEMKIMKGLNHPNIVEFVEHHEEEGYLYIIMEFVRHGDLQGYLAQHGTLTEEQAKLMAQQILSALHYLHRRSITHRDIKPDNILIADMNPLKVKLSDFGLSKVVQNDETFLKTFCGTLLYCAPEVFPHFEGKPTKGTKRRRGTKQQFHSYSSSVDIWSFAGVLWFSLCGKPPFEGIADATGQAMYNNIMSTRLDPTPLQEVGVSQTCIDLLLRMLDTDPSNRPTDRQCLLHPWLRDGATIPPDPTLESIVEEDEATAEAGSNLSQLSIDDELSESDEEMDDEVLEDEEFERLVSARSKKVRTDPLFPRNQFRDNENDSSADPSFQSDQYVESPSAVEESFRPMSRPLHQPRLFGEIGQSALESSGVLGVRANDALSHEGSSEVLLDSHVPGNVTTTSYHGAPGPHQTPTKARFRAQLDGGLTSPSLLGAEALVGELNMASPQSFGSVAHSENEPATPKTPDVPQHNSLENNNQLPSQFSDSTPKAKPPAFNRQISLPKTPSYYFDPSDPSTHTLEYASKVSGFDYVGAAGTAKTAGAKLPDTMRFSAHASTSAGPSLPSNRVSSEPADDDTTSEHDSEVHYAEKGVVPSLPPELDIKPPPRRLGKLTATLDSFAPHLTLHIDQSRTSWGRLPSNTLVYESSRDTRIPKTAFNIFWYSPNTTSFTVQELSQQGKDWTALEGLRVGIFTCASNGISINGKHLRQKDDKGRALYGHLHNGDIIQVYHSADGTESLKFRCEFYQGLGKEPRKAGTSFTIQVGNKLPA